MFVDISFFFFNDTATTEIYTLSLHDALPISHHAQRHAAARRSRRGARAGWDGDIRGRLPLPDSGARLGPDGPRAVPRRVAVRARAVVSAHGGVRRRPRLEHRAVPGSGRVLP